MYSILGRWMGWADGRLMGSLKEGEKKTGFRTNKAQNTMASCFSHLIFLKYRYTWKALVQIGFSIRFSSCSAERLVCPRSAGSIYPVYIDRALNRWKSWSPPNPPIFWKRKTRARLFSFSARTRPANWVFKLLTVHPFLYYSIRLCLRVQTALVLLYCFDWTGPPLVAGFHAGRPTSGDLSRPRPICKWELIWTRPFLTSSLHPILLYPFFYRVFRFFTFHL